MCLLFPFPAVFCIPLSTAEKQNAEWILVDQKCYAQRRTIYTPGIYVVLSLFSLETIEAHFKKKIKSITKQ